MPLAVLIHCLHKCCVKYNGKVLVHSNGTSTCTEVKPSTAVSVIVWGCLVNGREKRVLLKTDPLLDGDE